jgi:hypothetical protein
VFIVGWCSFVVLPKYKLVFEFKYKGSENESFDDTIIDELIECNESVTVDKEEKIKDISIENFANMMTILNKAIMIDNNSKWGVIFNYFKKIDNGAYITTDLNESDNKKLKEQNYNIILWEN